MVNESIESLRTGMSGKGMEQLWREKEGELSIYSFIEFWIYRILRQPVSSSAPFHSHLDQNLRPLLVLLESDFCFSLHIF